MGFRLYGGSFSAGYTSNALPQNSLFSAAASTIGGDYIFSGGLSMGWTRRSERTNMSVMYMPSYSAQTRYSNVNSLMHNLNINVGEQLSHAWMLTGSATAMTRTTQQALFSPTALGRAASLPSTTDTLGSAMVTGSNTDPQLASILNAPAVADTAASSTLYGQRYLTSGVSMGVGSLPQKGSGSNSGYRERARRA